MYYILLLGKVISFLADYILPIVSFVLLYFIYLEVKPKK